MGGGRLKMAIVPNNCHPYSWCILCQCVYGLFCVFSLDTTMVLHQLWSFWCLVIERTQKYMNGL